MKDCVKCGKNNWKWECVKGLMTGYCQSCGRKTNTFKANGRHNNNKEQNLMGTDSSSDIMELSGKIGSDIKELKEYEQSYSSIRSGES